MMNNKNSLFIPKLVNKFFDSVQKNSSRSFVGNVYSFDRNGRCTLFSKVDSIGIDCREYSINENRVMINISRNKVIFYDADPVSQERFKSYIINKFPTDYIFTEEFYFFESLSNQYNLSEDEYKTILNIAKTLSSIL